MEVAILSNSHVAMLKMATDGMGLSWKPTYFAAPAARMGGLQYDPGSHSLSARRGILLESIKKTSGGLERINLTHFDALILAGLTLKTQTALELFRHFQPLGLRVDDSVRLISEMAFRTALREMYDTTSAAKLLKLCAHSGKPIYLVPSPLPSELLLVRKAYRWGATQAGIRALSWINGLCSNIWADMAADAGAKLVTQPAHTIGKFQLTKAIYSRGAQTMQAEDYAEADTDHMNAEFGRLILEQIDKAFSAHVSRSRAA